jgi:hypothetical protein
MIQRALFLFAALCGFALTVGCANQQKSFDVTVTNRIGDPITVWMTKTLPPPNGHYEEGWMPPEAVAVGTTASESGKLGGIALNPGDTGHANLKGTFNGGDVAVLRVYRSTDLNTMLAIPRGNPDRIDIPLDPGKTDIDIVKQNGEMTFVPHGTPSPSP